MISGHFYVLYGLTFLNFCDIFFLVYLISKGKKESGFTAFLSKSIITGLLAFLIFTSHKYIVWS